MGVYANSEDPVQTSHSVVSDQDQHCLLTGISMENTIKMKAFTRNPQKKKWTDSHIRMDKSISHQRFREADYVLVSVSCLSNI